MGRAAAVVLLAAVGFAGAPLPDLPSASDAAICLRSGVLACVSAPEKASRSCGGAAAAASSRPRGTCWPLWSPAGCCWVPHYGAIFAHTHSAAAGCRSSLPPQSPCLPNPPIPVRRPSLHCPPAAALVAAAEFSPNSIPDWVYMGKQRPTAQEDLDFNYQDVAVMNGVGKVGVG